MKDAFAFTPTLIGSSSTAYTEYTGDPFEGNEGHFVGNDGFVVPKDFVEFYERYPNYVRNWVSKRMRKSSADPDVEDWTNTLLMHLCSLPKGKEVLDEETNEIKITGGKLYQLGFTDVINAFNPWSVYGASAKRFFSFINRCLQNKLISLSSKKGKDAMTHIAFSLTDPNPDSGSEDNQRTSHEYLLMDKSTLYANEVNAEMPKTMDRILVEQFTNFLEKKNPDLIPLAKAIMDKDGVEEIVRALGINHNTFLRSRKKLIQLSKDFVKCRSFHTPVTAMPILETPMTPENQPEVVTPINTQEDTNKQIAALSEAVITGLASISELKDMILALTTEVAELKIQMGVARKDERERVLSTLDRVSGGILSMDTVRKAVEVEIEEEPVEAIPEPVVVEIEEEPEQEPVLIEVHAAPGRPKRSLLWYNNGTEERRVMEPIVGFIPGRLKRPKALTV